MSNFKSILSINQALSDPTRLRMWMLLHNQELCVCHIREVFGLAVSTISEHLSVLRKAGLILSKKDGKWVYYQAKLSLGDLSLFLKELKSSLEKNEQMLTDNERSQKIMKETVC